MTEETTDVTATDALQNNNINISIEQICASIIATLDSVVVPIETLLQSYEGKSIAVNQDPETKAITFTLADAPAPVVTEDTEQESE